MMTAPQRIQLPSPIALVPTAKLQTTLHEVRRRFAYVPDLSGIHAELRRLSAAGGVPARIETSKGDPRLVVYGQNYFLSLYRTKLDDLYSIGYVDRLRYSDHDRLAKGAMRLSPPDWHIFTDKGQVLRENRRYTTHWPAINSAWQQVCRTSDEPARSLLPPHHAEYLDRLDTLADAVRDVEAAQQDTAPMVYRDVRATTEQRYSGRGVYVFDLARPVTLNTGRLVQVEDEPQLRGKVLRIDGRELTIRFDTAIDHQTVPRQGTIREIQSETVYRKQRAAVAILRDGRAANPALLATLADGRFIPFRPDDSAQPRGPLDDDQRLALRKACAVPDILLVQGPPGTGKSWTIAETAREYAARGLRVLVSSHTNRAVDNVLEKLPGDLLALRVGNEGSLTEFARTKMLETLAVDIQRMIRARSEGLASRLRALVANDQVERWLRLLATETDRAAHGQEAVAHYGAALADTDQRVTAPIRDRIGALEQELRQRTATRDALSTRYERSRQARDKAVERGTHGLFAPVYRWLAQRRATRAENTFTALGAALLAHDTTAGQLATTRGQLEPLRATNPELTHLRHQVAAATAERDDARQALAAAHEEIERLTYGLVEPPTVIEDDPTGWPSYLGWCRANLPLLRARADLLLEWRAVLDQPADQLYPELVRYADVVAATCIGVATSDLLAELDFDIVIVDEAGQISLSNVLVPMVRGRRTMLVGDHMQLPPFVADEVRDHPLAALLVRSAFESLTGTAPASHQVRLRKQRRMPRVVADFVSTRFYGGWLETATDRRHHDPLFRSAFAIVDTSDLPASERAERGERARRSSGSTAWSGPGYDNPTEAALITRLIVRAVRAGMEWAVIAPYQAQVALIRQLLNAELRAATLIEDNVGTVDSFQGGERDLIVYGCTRSNSAGEVGFLTELRRFNVAITRAKEQLVVVGDMRTLTNATDHGVRELMSAMVTYVRADGDLRPSRTVLA
jgi:hypothetical protein